MELGATVCSVKSPSCSTCPVRTSCLAHKLTAPGPTGLKSETSSEERGTATAVTISSGGSRSKITKRAPKTPSGDKTPFSDEQNKCGCSVCEVGEDGMAVMPVAVTDYPRKAPKT